MINFIKNTIGFVALLAFLFFPNKSSSQQAITTAKITVIRSAGETLKNRPISVYINGEKKCLLTDAHYTTFSVNEGENTVFAALNKTRKIKDKIRESSLSIKAVPSQQYYVLIVITDPKRSSISITPILESGALKLIKDYNH